MIGFKIYAAILAVTWLTLFAFCMFAKFGVKYSALFATIQTAAGPFWAPLVLAGFPICFVLARFKIMEQDAAGLFHWPRWAWLWDNKEDGVHPGWYASQFPNWSSWHIAFEWTARRNTVNNLRYVWGISGVGRPLFYWEKDLKARSYKVFGRTFTAPSEIYVKAGWLPNNGFPACSAGAGRGF